MILRRRQAEAAAEERALHRTKVTADSDCRRAEAPMAANDADTAREESFAVRLASLWKQLTGD